MKDETTTTKPVKKTSEPVKKPSDGGKKSKGSTSQQSTLA